jgi:AcrR family transcriptional regulator
MSEQESERDRIPRSVALLWGLRQPTRRGPKAGLSVEQITQAAIEVADAEGLAAVSMARVAQQLGAGTMSLYRYIASKDELLLLMSDAALTAPPAPPEGAGWREALRHWAYAVLAELRRHSWYVQIPLAGPPTGPRNLAWFDAALRTLAETGMASGDQVMAVMTLITFVQGEVRMTAELIAAEDAGAPGAGEIYGGAIASLIDPVTYPALSAAVAEGIFDDDRPAADQVGDDIGASLEIVLDGIAALIERRAGVPPVR